MIHLSFSSFTFLVILFFLTATCIPITNAQWTSTDSSTLSSTNSLYPPDPDQEATIEQLVNARNFALEVYTVVTEDDYILSLHRLIPRNIRSSSRYAATRKPVIVQHGLFGASTDFMINSPHLFGVNGSATCDNFAFALLLTGKYDVWLGNTRGNEYSQQHARFAKNHRTGQMDRHEYWNFSFDQIAAYDLPAVIAKVRSVTGHPTVAYIGYSQGTTAMFALLASRPEYGAIIRPFIAWAPVVYMRHITSPFRYLAPIATMLRSIGDQFAPSSSSLLSTLSQPLCKLPAFTSACTNALFLFGGYDADRLNHTRLPVYFHFTPATVSTWQVVHYLQLMSDGAGRFRRFDHESAEANRARYGRAEPPTYRLRSIPANLTIVLVRSRNDYLSSIPDTDRLIQELRARGGSDSDRSEAAEKVFDYLVSEPMWTHLDFILGSEAGRLVYKPTIEYLDRFA